MILLVAVFLVRPVAGKRMTSLIVPIKAPAMVVAPLYAQFASRDTMVVWESLFQVDPPNRSFYVPAESEGWIPLKAAAAGGRSSCPQSGSGLSAARPEGQDGPVAQR